LSPQRHSQSSLLWMAFLLVMSTLNVGLGLRTFARVHRGVARYWLIATALWGLMATAVIRFLMLH
jgi:heme/copper-type cytochrome/quinol oxidase subunit 3